MFKKNDPRRATFVRGQILQILYTAAMGEALNPDDPYLMARGVLVAAMEQLGVLPAEAELHSSLRYLEEKGYIDVDWAKDGTGGFVSIRLQAKGIDLVEGTDLDRGVFFVTRRT